MGKDMNYFVEEIQTYENGTAAQLSFGPLEEDDAQEKYHLCLAAAAKSGLPCHSVTILDGESRQVERKCYKHKTEGEQA